MDVQNNLDSNMSGNYGVQYSNDSNGMVGSGEEEGFYSPLFGMKLAIPEWEAIMTIVALGTVIVTTIIGK